MAETTQQMYFFVQRLRFDLFAECENFVERYPNHIPPTNNQHTPSPYFPYIFSILLFFSLSCSGRDVSHSYLPLHSILPIVPLSAKSPVSLVSGKLLLLYLGKLCHTIGRWRPLARRASIPPTRYGRVSMGIKNACLLRANVPPQPNGREIRQAS